MKTNITQNIKSIILILILVLGVEYISAYSTWAPPTATAPGNNTDTPINVNNVAQTKIGSLTLGGLGIVGDFKFLPVSGTPPTSGQVLMADNSDLTHGKVKWETVSGGSMSGFLPTPAYDSGWITVPDTTNYTGWSGAKEITLTHNLRTSNTFVYLEMNDRFTDGGVGNFWGGVEDTSADNQRGFSWAKKTNNTIKIVRGNNELVTSTVRVRIWKIGS